MKVQPTTKELIAMLYERLPELFDRAAPVQEPVATLWQHGETGRTRITMPGDITDCDARWFKAADLYTTPPAAQEDIQRLSALVRAQQITIDKLEQARSAPVQEPVAWVRLEAWQSGAEWPDDCFTGIPADGLTPLYTTPQPQQAEKYPDNFIDALRFDVAMRDSQKWTGLTDEEVDYIADEHSTLQGAIRAIEAKLKEKNT